MVEIPFPADRLAGLESAHEATVTAMRQGADVIYQGTFFDGRWRCHADFLLRVDQPSGLGRYRYEVADAKLAKKAKAAAVLQCCVYTEQVAAIQGIEPDRITLILGDRSEEELRFRDYAAYYRTVDGVRVAYAATVRRGGQPILERHVTDIKINAAIDPGLFKRP